MTSGRSCGHTSMAVVDESGPDTARSNRLPEPAYLLAQDWAPTLNRLDRRRGTRVENQRTYAGEDSASDKVGTRPTASIPLSVPIRSPGLHLPRLLDGRATRCSHV